MMFLDGTISRIDGIIMLCVFFVWLGATIVEARKQRSAADEVLGQHGGWRIIAACTAGLGFLIFAGNFIVADARGIAIAFGVDEFVIGATIVAVGTSVPELATTLIAKLRGHDEVGLGTVLGSNILNGLLIVSIAAIINPITLSWREVVVALTFGLLVLFPVFPTRNGEIGGRRGYLLLVLYVVYLAIILQSQR